MNRKRAKKQGIQ